MKNEERAAFAAADGFDDNVPPIAGSEAPVEVHEATVPADPEILPVSDTSDNMEVQ